MPSPPHPPLDASEARIVAFLERCAAGWQQRMGASDTEERRYAMTVATAYFKAARHIREGLHRE